MDRAYYSESIKKFLARQDNSVLGLLSKAQGGVEAAQNEAWQEQIKILKQTLKPYSKQGKIYFEYSIPRLGGRIDVVLIIKHVIFVLEFKVGATRYDGPAIDQVCDYALDLKNFHRTSHTPLVAPILVATNARSQDFKVVRTARNDGLLSPLKANAQNLAAAIQAVLKRTKGKTINPAAWERGEYYPTPTIIEAAVALYNDHQVEEIARNDAGANNLVKTSKSIANIIKQSKRKSQKAICFVTGVPGAGKTLVGLDIATKEMKKQRKPESVFLSGNGPLVNVLREALALDQVRKEGETGNDLRIGEARSNVKTFIQNIHHFRDDFRKHKKRIPPEHVVLFDEAQRTWDKDTISNFMQRKKNVKNFKMSEPEFLISCMDRHKKWAVIVCLVGGGQEIGKGEVGISAWLEAIQKKFPKWRVYISSRLTDSEYGSRKTLANIKRKTTSKNLHLTTSMRSFRAENVSLLVKQVLDIEEDAHRTLEKLKNYPIYLTRDFNKAKEWVRTQARGSERYGMVVSSNAERLKPYAVDVRPRINPVHWFLKDRDDVRSSFYLEDVCTEFEVQGLELDWACMAWDADFRYENGKWNHWRFQGNSWQRLHNEDLQNCQKNAYRVLLTRARQGMVIVVPKGDKRDHTRQPQFYNPTFNYLKEIGFRVI